METMGPDEPPGWLETEPEHSVTSVVEFWKVSTEGILLIKNQYREIFFDLIFNGIQMGQQKVPKFDLHLKILIQDKIVDNFNYQKNIFF